GGICSSLIAELEDVAAQIFVLDERLQVRVDVARVDDDALAATVGGLERDRLEQSLEHRVQPPRADVLAAVVDLKRDLGEPPHAARLERDREALGLEQARVLLRQRRARLRENAHEVVDAERRELDADRESALELGDEIRRLRDAERARRDEQHVIRAHHAVARADGAPFDERQEIALHALARYVGAVRLRAPRDLVDLVDEDDAVLLDGLDGLELHVFLIDELRGFLFLEQRERVLDLELAALRAALMQVLKQALELIRHLLHAGGRHDLDADGRRRDVELDLAVRKLALAQHLPKALPRLAARVLARARQQRVEKAILGGVLRAIRDASHGFLARHLDGHVDQVAHDRVDVAADVADLREFRRLDLDERRVRELREPARDLGLADAGRPDHQDVLRRDLAAQRLLDLRAAPTVAQRNGHGTLRVVLADDVLVELLDDFARRHRHGARA